jgi:magnesium transporter
MANLLKKKNAKKEAAQIACENDSISGFSLEFSPQEAIYTELHSVIAPAKSQNLWIHYHLSPQSTHWQEIQNTYQLNPLYILDCKNTDHTSKCEQDDDAIFFIGKAVKLENLSHEALDFHHVGIFFFHHLVITVSNAPVSIFEPLVQKIKKGGILRNLGVPYLFSILVDTLNSTFYQTIDQLGSKVDDLELQVLKEPSQDILRIISKLKIQLLTLAKMQTPLKDSIFTLIEKDSPIQDKFYDYFKDACDHAQNVNITIKNYRELLSSLLDIYVSFISLKTNETISFLTIFSAIFIPLTFIVGVYGMNFDYMPELRMKYGYHVTLIIMFLISFTLLVYFRRKGWIGRRSRQFYDHK